MIGEFIGVLIGLRARKGASDHNVFLWVCCETPEAVALKERLLKHRMLLVAEVYLSMYPCVFHAVKARLFGKQSIECLCPNNNHIKPQAIICRYLSIPSHPIRAGRSSTRIITCPVRQRTSPSLTVPRRRHNTASWTVKTFLQSDCSRDNPIHPSRAR
jgi:hypothetical protein